MPAAPAAGPAPVAAATLVGLVSAPPVQLESMEEIAEQIRRCEEVAKFLREQTDFWMEQVRHIQRSHLHPAAAGAAAGLASPPWAPETPAPRGPTVDSEGQPAAAPSGAEPGSAEACRSSGSPGSPSDQMAELRRLQEEAWFRKRRSAAAGAGDAGEG
ncbi:unnamed protein product [Prorocentrum cordatum]|uniref:Uncharacterized protein n=1 Tax=Prorocentrum cordatum TaxID=2364126 RepID=A0ABN9U268_9DINO|nr:unnamed protein product [Polarella glacialis]